jgi:hypothetical protein
MFQGESRRRKAKDLRRQVGQHKSVLAKVSSYRSSSFSLVSFVFSDDNWQNPIMNRSVFEVTWDVLNLLYLFHNQMNWVLPSCNQNINLQYGWECRFIFCFKKFLR